MNIQQIFHDPRIVMLEEEIARKNEYCRYSDEERHVMKYLLEERRNVLWHLNVYNDETKRLLIDFNDALRNACAELYRRTMAVYQECLHREVKCGLSPREDNLCKITCAINRMNNP